MDTLDWFGPQGLGRNIFNTNLIVEIVLQQLLLGQSGVFLGIFSIRVIHDTLKSQSHVVLVQHELNSSYNPQASFIPKSQFYWNIFRFFS